MVDERDVKDLQQRFPASFANGVAYAEAHLRTLAKMAQRGMLAHVVGLASLPQGAEPPEIDAFVERLVPPAERMVRRDLEEGGSCDESEVRAFLGGFRMTLRQRLSAP